MLKIEDFSKKYGDKTAVSQLDLTIGKGEIYGFIGHNGAGKTTTIKAVAGILGFEEGQIYIDGGIGKRRSHYLQEKDGLYPG